MSKNVLERYQSIVNGNLSATLTSPVTNIKYLDNVLIELICTGSPNGTFFVEFSADYNQDLNQNALNSGTWVPLDFGTNPPTITTATDIMLDLNQMPAPFVRVRWVPVSGSGTVNMWISAKGL